MKSQQRLCILGVLVALLMLAAGCSQQTGVPQAADTQQEAATQGSSVNVWILNAPGADPAMPLTDLGPVSIEHALADLKGPGEADSVKASSGAYVQDRITLNITTGGTTPGLTSTATGTQTVNPNQQPEASIAADVGLTGQGVVDQGATAGLGSGTVSSEKQSEIDQQLATLKAATSTLETFLEKFMGQEATGTPETATSETP